jgi:hypothetical protein
MSTKEITKQIQAGVGVTADGIYGPNTALAIIKGLKLSEKELTKFIQEKVGSLPDGVYGKNTGKSILDSLGLGTKEKEHVSVPSAIVDGKYPEVYKASPNVSSSRIVPEGVVLHHSSGSYNGSVSWILQDRSNVSYHCIINTDGSRTSFAEDDRRCWHAGKSRFKGRGGCNGFLLGLAFSGNTKTRELTEDEIASAVEWLLPRFEKWDWPTDLSTVTTHKEISPGRKDDVDSRAEQAILKALKAAL